MDLKNKVPNMAKNKGRLAAVAAVIALVIAGLAILMSRNISVNPTLPQSRDIFTLYDTYDMTVVVVFDEEPPIVQFIAPDRSLVDMEEIRYRNGSNFIQYFLPNAMPGVWRMAYDPLTNTEITTPYSVYMESIFIRSFEADAIRHGNGIIPVTFEVSADNTGEFAYELHAVFTAADNSIAEEFLLIRGYGMLNEVLSLDADAGKIQDMGGFMLRLTAHVQHGQAAIVDTAWLDLRLHANLD